MKVKEYIKDKYAQIKQWILQIVMLRFHSHKWEYKQDNWQTVRRCKCGVAHVNKHIVSKIYGGEHWYDHNEA